MWALLAWSGSAGALSAPAPNAALAYWQALAVLDDADAERHDDVLAEWDTAPLDRAVDAALGELGSVRHCVARAVAIRECDWGLAVEDGPGALLPHLGRMRRLARVMALSARWHFARGESAAGLDEALAVFTMARHVGGDGLLIGYLVQVAIEQMGVELTAAHLLQLDQAQLTRLAAGLKQLPAGGDCASAVASEKQWMLGWLQRRLEASGEGWQSAFLELTDAVPWPAIAATRSLGQPAQALALLQAITPEDYARLQPVFRLPPEQRDTIRRFRAFLEALPPDQENIIALLSGLDMMPFQAMVQEHRPMTRIVADLAPLYDEATALMRLPYAEFATAVKPFEEKISNGNPLAKAMFPAILPVRRRAATAAARRNLLHGAIDLLAGGNENGTPAPDEFGPITRRAEGNGFVLISSFIDRDEPVRLHCRGAAKPLAEPVGPAAAEQPPPSLTKASRSAAELLRMLADEEGFRRMVSTQLTTELKPVADEAGWSAEDLARAVGPLSDGSRQLAEAWHETLERARDGDRGAAAAVSLLLAPSARLPLNLYLCRAWRAELGAAVGEERTAAFITALEARVKNGAAVP